MRAFCQLYMQFDFMNAFLVSICAALSMSALPAIAAEPVVPPFVETFDDSGSYGRFAIIDANNDGTTFEIADGVAKVRFAFSFESFMSMPTDDWLVLPPMQLDEGKGYVLSFDAYGEHARYYETFEVFIAQQSTADALSAGQCVVEPTVVNCTADNPLSVEQVFSVESSGIYYIGIHGCSAPDQYYLYVDNISVSDGISAAAPGPVTDARVERDPAGGISATISYTAPSVDWDGNLLTDLGGIKIFRDGTLVVTRTPAVGTADSFVDDDVTEGYHLYTLVPFNAHGDGEAVKIETYVGINRPAAVEDFKVKLGGNTGTAVLTWSPVTEDITGVSLPDGNVTYKVMRVFGLEQTVIAEGVTETTYTDVFCRPTSKQAGVYYTVVPVNSAGEGLPANAPYICLGAPYSLPFAESFPDEGSDNEIWVTDGPASWSIPGDSDYEQFASADGDNGFLYVYSSDKDNPSSITSGMISLAGVPGAELTFYTLNYAVFNNNTIDVMVDLCDGDGFKAVETVGGLNTVDGTFKWVAHRVNLSEYAGKIVRLSFRFSALSQPAMGLDNIVLKGLWPCNLAIGALQAPLGMTAGVEGKISAVISNIGSETATGYTVDLYRDNSVVDQIEGETLAPGESKVVEFAQIPSSLWAASVTYRVEIDYSDDGETSDNITSERSVGIRVSSLPAPGSISATAADAALALTWSAPVIENVVPAEVNDDLSGLTPFSTGIAGSVLAGEDNMGDWSVIDADGLPSIKVGVDFPNAGSAMAFMPFNQKEINIDWESLRDHGGDGTMFVAFAAVGGRNDDWLVSPRLTGESQRISFYVRALSDQYNEQYEVYYSTTGKEPADFTIIEGSHRQATYDWTQVSYTLPAGARYFAIRYVAFDLFGLVLDDFTYTPAGETDGVGLKGYNLYHNGFLVNSDGLLDAPEAKVAGFKEGDCFQVTAMYSTGESAPSAPYVYGSSAITEIDGGNAVGVAASRGEITVTAPVGVAIMIVDVSGRQVVSATSAGTETFPIPAGVYIVSAGGKRVKTVVR